MKSKLFNQSTVRRWIDGRPIVRWTLLVAVLSVFGQSCETPNQPVQPTPVATTDAQARLAADDAINVKVKLVAKILRKLYKDPTIRAEVNATIESGFYKDERVALKDLLNPTDSPLYKSKKFEEKKRAAKVTFESGKFAKEFAKVAAVEAPKAGSAKGRMADDYFNWDGVQIYYPYSENFYGSSAPITVAEPGEDPNGNWAPDPRCDDTPCCYQYCQQPVWVNDDYADANPTHIVNAGSPEGSAGFNQNKPVVNLIQLGWIRCNKQGDDLFDSRWVRPDLRDQGGSEVRVGRISGYLKFQDEQVTSFEDFIPIDFTRRDVRRGTWKRIYSTWDSNWEPDNKEQVLAIWEDDNTGTRKYTGSVTTKVKVGRDTNNTAEVSGNSGYDITVRTRDELWRQLKWNRESFFRTARADQGHGFYDGWPIYDGAGYASYTLVTSTPQ